MSSQVIHFWSPKGTLILGTRIVTTGISFSENCGEVFQTEEHVVGSVDLLRESGRDAIQYGEGIAGGGYEVLNTPKE